MTENQFTPETGFQYNQPLQDNLKDNHTVPGIYQDENFEKRDSNQRKEFPERNHQHDYKSPSANQIENDEEDEFNSDEENFDQVDKTKTNHIERQTDVSDLGLV